MNADLLSMTVRELVELLQGADQDRKVLFSSNYGDRARTQQALPVRGELETVQVYKTAYSESGFAVADELEDKRSSVSDEKFLLIK